MARLIDIEPAVEPMPAELTVATGDVLRFAASGGRVITGTAVDLLGIYTTSVVGTDGRVLTPMGPPDVVMFRASVPGRAQIDVFTGDPYRSAGAERLSIAVEG